MSKEAKKLRNFIDEMRKKFQKENEERRRERRQLKIIEGKD